MSGEKMDEIFSSCSLNRVPKTDSCTKCYSEICGTCQIRQDFLYNEVTSKKHSSELYVDQIYTCNKCDQSWMDKYYFCFNCGRLVCESYVDGHETCPDLHSLVESDVIKRRRLMKTCKDLEQFETTLKRNKEDLENIRKEEQNSELLLSLTQASTCLRTKIDETINSFSKESKIFQDKVFGIDQYIQQQSSSFEKLKGRLQNIKTDTFPVAFLQHITEWDNLFSRLSQNQSKLDLSGLRNTSIANVECKTIDYDKHFVNNILGVCGKIPDSDRNNSKQYVHGDDLSETTGPTASNSESNYGRLVCESYVDGHETCPDLHSLVESDVIKRRRLMKTCKDLEQFETTLKRNKEDLENIRKEEQNSELLLSLTQASTCLRTKIDETINSFSKESKIFQDKVFGIDQYIQQQSSSFEKLKGRLQNIKTDTFPVAFLQHIAEWDNLFSRLSQNQSKLDLSGLRNTSIANVECKTIDYDKHFVNSILGVCGKIPDSDRNNSKQYVHGDDLSETTGPTASNSESNYGRQRRKTSTMPRPQKSSSESAWYSNHLLKKELASKNEQINRLETKCVELKQRLQLTKQSRDATKTKLLQTETSLAEHRQNVISQVNQMNLSYQLEVERKENEKLDTKKELLEVKSELDRSNTKHSKYVMSLMTEIESLKQEMLSTKDKLRNSEESRASMEREAYCKIERCQSECKQSEGLIDVLNLQIKGLQDHIHLIEKDKDRNVYKERISSLEGDNQRLKAKLDRLRKLFNEWTRSSSSFNSRMSYELNENVDVIKENKLLKEQIAAIDNSRKEATDLLNNKSDSSDMMSEEDVCGKTKKSTTVLGDISTENNKRKHITSISYAATNINIIQNSQVSLADSGYDAKSLFDENDYTTE